MNKKIQKLFIVLFVLALTCSLLGACNANDNKNNEPFCVIIDGDIDGDIISINLNEVKQTTFEYNSDNVIVSLNGWDLKSLLKDIKKLYDDNYLMISGKDGTSVLIEGNLTSNIYLYKSDEDTLCVKAPDYPRAVGIKDIEDITVITKSVSQNTGYKILSPDNTKYISRGNAKLLLYEKSAENILNENIAFKYILPSTPITIYDLTRLDNCIVYLNDYDYIKNADNLELFWEKGALKCKQNNTIKSIYGIATNADFLIDNVYYDIKNALNSNEKVLFIETDGFSLQQANYFADELSTLKPNKNTKVALSTHLSISPVALASICTGKSPFVNGVHFDTNESRAVLTPTVEDIFDYAAKLGKKQTYIECDGKLVNFSLNPQFGLTDKGSYDLAIQAIKDDNDFIFVHFHEIDDINHTFSPLSNESKSKILDTEFYINQLIQQFNGKVIITSDHGHNTLVDKDGKVYGKHGLFTNNDMYVPYYVFN